MQRSYVKDVFNKKGKVKLAGWVYDSRDLSKIRFIVLKDVTGIIQVIIKDQLNEDLGEINRQSVVRITGTVQDTKAKDFDYEVKNKQGELDATVEKIEKILKKIEKKMK